MFVAWMSTAILLMLKKGTNKSESLENFQPFHKSEYARFDVQGKERHVNSANQRCGLFGRTITDMQDTVDKCGNINHRLQQLRGVPGRAGGRELTTVNRITDPGPS